MSEAPGAGQCVLVDCCPTGSFVLSGAPTRRRVSAQELLITMEMAHSLHRTHRDSAHYDKKATFVIDTPNLLVAHLDQLSNRHTRAHPVPALPRPRVRLTTGSQPSLFRFENRICMVRNQCRDSTVNIPSGKKGGATQGVRICVSTNGP
jgi:hypothetical protein